MTGERRDLRSAIGGPLLVGLSAVIGTGILVEAVGVLEDPPRGVLIAVGGVLLQVMLGELEALGLALAGLDERPMRRIGVLVDIV